MHSTAPSILAAVAIAGACSGCYENFGKTQILSSGAGVEESRIVVDLADRIHLVYVQGGDLAARSSLDRGASWGDVTIDDGVAGGGNRLAVHSDTVEPDHLYAYYWVDDPALRFARTTDGGATWVASEITAAGIDSARGLCLGIDPLDRALVLAYDASGAAYSRYSADSGASWSAPSVIRVGDAANLRMWKLSFLSDGELIALFSDTADDRSAQTFFVASSWDKGQSWGSSIPLHDPNPGEQAGAGDLIVLDDELHAAFSTRLGDRSSVNHAARSGEDWEVESAILENTQSVVADVRLATALAGLPILASYRRAENIYYQIWDGSTWTFPARLNNAWKRVPEHYGGMGLLSDAAIGATWTDDRLQPGASADLAFALSDPSNELDYGVSLVDSTLVSSLVEGDSIAFDFEVGNWTSWPGTVDVWVEYSGVRGRSGLLLKGRISLSSGESRILRLVRLVPIGTAAGWWDLKVLVGDYPVADHDTDMFSVEVISAPPVQRRMCREVRR